MKRPTIAINAGIVLSVAALLTSALALYQALGANQRVGLISEGGVVCSTGADGKPGPCGPVGATGPCGPQGIPGPAGAEGEAGQTGTTGSTGAVGPRGEQGETGATGATGTSGRDGADGITTLGHHGSFFDSTDQQNTQAVVRAMRLNSSDPSNCGVYVSGDSNSKIFVTRTGVYNLQFSAQLRTNSNQTQPVDIWLAKNGEAVEMTNTQFFAPDRKGIYIAAWNFVVQLNAGDYLELMWYSADTSIYLSQLPAQSTLGIPAVPSLIATLTQVG